jgi:hypothetical protein
MVVFGYVGMFVVWVGDFVLLMVVFGYVGMFVVWVVLCVYLVFGCLLFVVFCGFVVLVILQTA